VAEGRLRVSGSKFKVSSSKKRIQGKSEKQRKKRHSRERGNPEKCHSEPKLVEGEESDFEF